MNRGRRRDRARPARSPGSPLRPRAGRVHLLAGLLSTVALLAPGAAFAKPRPTSGAGPKDRMVLRIDDEALSKDYLETNFIRAEKKLQRAIAICGKKRCSSRVLAQIHRDLAVVYISGLGKIEAGKDALKTAIELDPDLQLDPDFATPEMKKAFNQVRGKRAGSEERRSSARKGIQHDPVGEQVVATPVPIFARYGGDSTKLKLWYKPVGGEHWRAVTMDKSGDGFAGEIPCTATAKTGELDYFIEVLGDGGDMIDKDGSRSEPHVVNIKNEISGDAPHIPDAEPPARCKDVCEGDDCGSGGGGSSQSRPRKNWITLTVQQDLAIVGAATDACAVGNQVLGSYSCFRSTGSQYLGNPILGDPGDSVNPGLALATTRLLIGYDRVLVGGLTLGIRLGYVVHGLGPRAEGSNVRPPLPFHVEGRLAYFFGADVFSKSGFRPFLFVAGGAAQVDSKFGVVVTEDTSVPPPAAQTDNPPAQHLDAYRRMGQGFAGGGAGFMVAFTPGVGLVLDAKYMRMFPTGGNVISPEAGLALGF